MLAPVHGVFDRSISTLITPWLVVNVSTWKPERGGSVGGLPTSLMPAGSEGVALGAALGSAGTELIQVHEVGVAEAPAAVGVELPPPVDATTIQTTAAITTTPATPAPMRACSRRLRRAASWRAAISRSSRARAAARWRLSRSETTAVLPRRFVCWSSSEDYYCAAAEAAVLGVGV